MADLQQLEEQIVGLSLLDAAALVKKLEERLGVSAAAAAPVVKRGPGRPRKTPLRVIPPTLKARGGRRKPAVASGSER